MSFLSRSIAILVVTFFGSNIAYADALSVRGKFVATQFCPAYVSIKKRTNPGNVNVRPGVSYTVTRKNKLNASHFLMTETHAKPAYRWVAASCGDISGISSAQSKKYQDHTQYKPSKNKGYQGGKDGDDFLLALSWQPAFCEARPDKAECKTQTTDRYDANYLSLHGLWPQPRSNVYCGVSLQDKSFDRRKKWASISIDDLSPKTLAKLSVVMPAVQSHLQKHEWIKHGTCYGQDPEVYFSHSIAILEVINDSEVGDLFRAHIGEQLSTQKIADAFDAAFGKGAGQKVSVKCNRQGMIGDLWVNLSDSSNIAQALAKAPNARSACRGGLVDKANHSASSSSNQKPCDADHDCKGSSLRRGLVDDFQNYDSSFRF